MPAQYLGLWSVCKFISFVAELFCDSVMFPRGPAKIHCDITVDW